MYKIIPSLLILLSGQVFCQDNDYRSYYAKAVEAYKSKSYPKFYSLIKEANEMHPWHQGVLYQLGMAAALTGHAAEAIESLKKAVLIDNSFRIEGLADFNSIKNTPEFKQLLALQKEWAVPIIHSDTAFTLTDRSLHCEGLELDPETKTFYVGSIHERKIVKVNGGVATNFCPPAFDGMTSVFGLKIDPKKKLLWACSSPLQEMENFDSTTRSAVFKFDQTTGKLIEKIERPSWARDGVFGDLILNKMGEVFISDGQTNTIFKVNEKTHQLEPWFTSQDFWNIQGMAFNENEKYLFISDYVKGLFRLEIKTKTLTMLACSIEVSLKGIDGLSYYDNSLIAVQNGVNPMRVTRYYLNSSQDQIPKFEILDRKHPAFNEPTLGTIQDDIFYYIANSQWGGYDQQHRIKPANQLQDIVILKVDLKKMLK
jgi:hypothetical protein